MSDAFSRRMMLTATAALAASRTALAAGPVFLDYAQEALDDAYTQGVWASNARSVIAGYATDSAAVRARMPPQTERYGTAAAETLDIFAPQTASGAPVMIFIHGGAWRALGKDDASAPAPTFVNAGCLYVALNFDNIPTTTLPSMVDQVRRAVLWVRANISRFGGDPGRLFVAGHSSGAHLCAVLLTTDWAVSGEAPGVVRGGLCISGIYELYPVVLSTRSSYVKLSEAEVDALSPLRHMGRLRCPVLVAHGGRESPEFIRQTRVFAGVLAGMGRLEGDVTMPELNHFELPNQLNTADTALSRAALAMMRQ